jgi:hypothetical protein
MKIFKQHLPADIIETEFLYKILPDIPPIPEHFFNQNLATDRKHHIPQIPHFEFTNREDGNTVSPEIKGWLAPQDMEDWVNQNIGPTNRGLMYRKVVVDPKKNFYPPHVDVNRKFIMIYNFVDSGGEFCFWQQKGASVFRSMLSRSMVFDYNDMILLEKFKPPVKTWYIVTTQVLHSVENLTGVRENIQFNCEPSDPLVVDNLIPIKKTTQNVF